MKRNAATLKNIAKRMRVDDTYHIDKDWISATKTKNYFLKDCVCDYFSMRKGNGSSTSTSSSTGSTAQDPVLSFVLQQGNIFEQRILSELKQRFITDDELVCVNERFPDTFLPTSKEAFQHTIGLLKQNIPIIYSGVLHRPLTRTYGMPDLIVKGNYLHKIFSKTEDNSITEGIFNQDNYYIIDIKFSTLTLRADGLTLLNSGLYPAYKSQVWTYTNILNSILDQSVEQAFILGRGYKYTCKNVVYKSDNPFDKFGLVDFVGVDKDIPSETKKAVEWLRTLNKEGKDWDLNILPLRKELYPNMANNYDAPYHSEKIELANRIAEITEIWMCGIKHREIAFINGIKGWKDTPISAKLLGFNEGYIANTVDAIIDINKGEEKIKINTQIPLKDNNTKELFVDFETLCDISAYDDLRSQSIFMIGVYDPDTNQYIDFTTIDTSFNEEQRIAKCFIDYLSLFNISHNSVKLYHWSHAEEKVWQRRGFILPEKCEFVDLCETFKKTPIVLKGCFDFSLKNIARAFVQNGLIHARLWKDDINNGVTAVIKFYELCKSGTVTHETLKPIIDYNEIDCKILYHILSKIREISNSAKSTS